MKLTGKRDPWVEPKKLNSFACLMVNVAPDGRPVRLHAALLMLTGVPFLQVMGGRLPQGLAASKIVVTCKIKHLQKCFRAVHFLRLCRGR